ncbi:MAG: ATP-binding protein [Edaphobacter sp.]|uniref:ATP-binding response regulator n=1 Tax=Edaphobacter sp. TaxID=1934404 RepID=UPI002383060F|nr:hybrid sensor histidine kinase/response regulator [Edaphobacter sp.]MDE1177093.1 ATP-binding protein [Edaphobacter sp.]
MCAARLEPTEIRVLLVEDNPDDAFLLERHLTRNGFRPTLIRVETEAEMLRELQATPRPELILADYHLPNFSGPQALQILRATGFDIPFIMLSGAVSEETAVEAMRSGAQDYVSKQNLLRLIPAIHRELKEVAARHNRLAAERALIASEARFASLVEVLPLGLLIIDAAGNTLYANKAVERLLGYTVTDLTSGDVPLSGLSASLESMRDHLLLHSVSASPAEITCLSSDGRSVETLAAVSLLNPDAAPAERQIAVSLADLTFQKQSEEAIRRTEKLAVAGRLAASISHEINNPLEAVINCLYLLGLSELTPDARNYLDLAQKELNRVSQITVQTLRFYRSSTRVGRADVHELIDSVLTLMEGRIRQADISVRLELKAAPTLSGHEGEIRQVIVNLISNAIDALSHGGVLVVRTRSINDPISGVRGIALTIADNGTGIVRATQKRIFEPFFSTKGITGTGLGLWISRELLSKHRGRITVCSRIRTSECPGGSVFRVFLPSESSVSDGDQRHKAIDGMPGLSRTSPGA